MYTPRRAVGFSAGAFQVPPPGFRTCRLGESLNIGYPFGLGNYGGQVCLRKLPEAIAHVRPRITFENESLCLLPTDGHNFEYLFRKTALEVVRLDFSSRLLTSFLFCQLASRSSLVHSQCWANSCREKLGLSSACWRSTGCMFFTFRGWIQADLILGSQRGKFADSKRVNCTLMVALWGCLMCFSDFLFFSGLLAGGFGCI